MHISKRQQSRALKEKLDDYWRGPYHIREVPENSTFYYLEEVDGTHLVKSIAGNQLKKFFSRELLDGGRERLHDVVRVREDQEEGEGEGHDLRGRPRPEEETTDRGEVHRARLRRRQKRDH